MAVIINGSNTPTAGSVTYGDGSTYANNASGTAGQVLTSAGAGVPTWVDQSTLAVGSATNATNANNATSATTATNLAGGSNGTIPYQSTSGATQMLAVGTAGQVLQTNGAGAPSWITPSAGAMTLISTATASSSSYIVFTGLDYSVYKQYMVLVSGAVPSVNAYTLTMQMSLDNGSSYITGGFDYYQHCLWLGTGTYNRQAGYNAGVAFQTPNGTSGTAAVGGINLNIYLNSLTNTNRNGVYFQGYAEDASSGGAPLFGGGQLLGFSGPVNAIRFYFNNGQLIASGTFKLYGIT